MRYTVVWFPAAQQRLAEIWLEESDRDCISAAANEIDRLLRAQDMIVEVRAVWRLPE